MVDGPHLYLGYEMVVSIAHHETSLYIRALFVNPYATLVIRHMGQLQETDRTRIVGGFAMMSLETLRSIGVL